MPTIKMTVQDLVDQVRSQLDESNQDSVDDNTDILPALNRGQDAGMNILARHYEDPLLKHAVLSLSSTTQEYDIPEDAFEDRLEKVEIAVGSDFQEVTRISYRDITDFETSLKTPSPRHYCIVGRKMRFIPAPTGTFDARLWYLAVPEKLVLPQGRVTLVNTASQYVVVDEAGSSLTTESDQLGSYINLVDGQTGIIKGSFQIQNIQGSTRVTMRTSPLRTSVLNRTIDTDLGDLASGLTPAADDYLCSIEGTAVPSFSKPMTNFLIQFAVAELTRKLGGAADMEERVLAKFEQQVERSWVGRETTLRVAKKSKNWGRIRRIWPHSS